MLLLLPDFDNWLEDILCILAALALANACSHLCTLRTVQLAISSHSNSSPPPLFPSLVQAGMTARICSLLRMLVEWATARSVPVVPHAWERAVAILATPPTQLQYFTVCLAIEGFFNGLRAPVLVLFGKRQLQTLADGYCGCCLGAASKCEMSAHCCLIA